MNSQSHNSYPVNGVNLREIKYKDIILPEDKNNMNKACEIIKTKLEKKLKLYGLMTLP